MITGFTPYISQPTSGSLPKRTYAHEIPPNQEEGGRGERGASADQPHKPAPSMTDVDRQLGGVGPRDQVRGAEQVEKLIARHPGPAPNDLLPHHRAVRGGAAEGGRPQPKEEASQLPQPGLLLLHSFLL